MEINLEVMERKSQGTSAGRRLRKNEDLIPAIVYGGNKEPRLIAIAAKTLRKVSENEAFFAQVITLKAAGASEKVVLKELQRHPFKPLFVHADFQRIREDVKLTMRIPLHFANNENCKGVKEQGGNLTYDMTEIDITCLPSQLPAFIEVDVAELELNQSIHLSDVKLPEGVDAVALLQDREGDHDLPVVRVIAVRAVEEEDALATESGAEEAVEGAEATAEE